MKGSCPCRLKESESPNPSLQFSLEGCIRYERASADTGNRKNMSQWLQYNTYFQNIRRERKGIQPKEAAVNPSMQLPILRNLQLSIKAAVNSPSSIWIESQISKKILQGTKISMDLIQQKLLKVGKCSFLGLKSYLWRRLQPKLGEPDIKERLLLLWKDSIKDKKTMIKMWYILKEFLICLQNLLKPEQCVLFEANLIWRDFTVIASYSWG